MKVSISRAADMVGITRATFYRHIEKKGISVEKDEDGNPKVDISELLRVYGNRVAQPEEQEGANSNNTPHAKQNGQHNTASDIQVELEVLREKVQNLEENKTQSASERNRERDQLVEQIENLKESLFKSQEQQKRLTHLLTDQREGQGDQNTQSQKLEVMEKTILKLRRQNQLIAKELLARKKQGFFKRLFG